MTSFVRQGVLLAASEALLACTSMLTSIVYARFLGPDGVGQLAVFMSTSTVLVPFASLGIGRANIYYLNSGRYARAEVVVNSLEFGVFGGGLLILIMTVLFRHNPDYFGHVPLEALGAFSLGIACQMVISLLRPILIADLNGSRLVMVDHTQRLIILVAAWVLALAGYLDVSVAMYGTALGALASMLLLVYFLRGDLDLSRRPPFRLAWLRETAVYGLKMAASGILFNLTAATTVLLIRQRLPDDFVTVGYYTRAVAVAGFATLIPSSLNPLFYAKWADARNRDRRAQIERAARFNVCYGMLAALGLIVLGQQLIVLLYGEAFAAAQQALVVLAPSMIVVCLFSVLNSLLASDGRAATTALALAGGLAIVSAATYLLVPTWGMRGAALAVLLGNLFATTMLAAVCRFEYGLRLSRMVLLNRADLRHVWLALADRGK